MEILRKEIEHLELIMLLFLQKNIMNLQLRNISCELNILNHL
jgi:hypothetical protein